MQNEASQPFKNKLQNKNKKLQNFIFNPQLQ